MSKRRDRRNRRRAILEALKSHIDKLSIAAIEADAKHQSDIENARLYAGERALDEIIQRSFAGGDSEAFYKGVMRALDDARYDIGLSFGKRAASELLKIDPAIQVRKLIVDGMLHQAASSMTARAYYYPDEMAHYVEVVIPPISRIFQI